MFSNRLAFAVLAVACVAAAAGGGYLANRQNAVPAPAAAQAPIAPAATSAAVSQEGPASPAVAKEAKEVQETEAVVGDSAKNTAEPSRPESHTPATRRSEPAPRVSRDARSTMTARREQPPALTSTWPSGVAQQPPLPVQPPTTMPPPPDPGRDVRDDRPAAEPQRPPEPPKPAFEELVIPSQSVIGLQMENRISTETARVEDRVEARVTRDVKVADRVAIPAGSRAVGSVTMVERGGKFKEQARLGIRFHTIVLADGSRLPIATETITRLGEAPGNGSAAKVGGGAAIGAILGAIIGGGKGAAIGAAAGGGAGSAAVASGDRSTVVLQPGTALTARVTSPVTVTVER